MSAMGRIRKFPIDALPEARARVTPLGSAALLCAASAIVLFLLVGCQAQGTGTDGSDAGQWPGQEAGYVGPNGEGVLDPEDYGSDAEYEDALIAEGERQADVPRKEVDTSGDGSSGYFEGMLVIHFFRDCGEARAREIVDELGGVWVSDTFAWGADSVDIDVEAYFPDAGDKESLQAIAESLAEMPEVSSSYLSTWFTSDDAVDD